MAAYGDMVFDYPLTTASAETGQQRVRQQPGSAVSYHHPPWQKLSVAPLDSWKLIL